MDNETLKTVMGLLERQTGAFEAIARGEKYKAAAATATGPASLYGTGGIFSTPGLEPDVISAYVKPHGLIARLPRFGSVFEDPRYGVLTGFTGTTGDEPANPCSDAPAGYMKACNLTAQFGRYQRDTQTIEFDKVMLQVNRGVSTDLALRGELLGMGDMNPADLNAGEVLDVYTMAEMVTAGANLERLLSQQLWQGSPANNNVGGGYKEFPGLDNQIATGHVDADTNTACPAVDSDVKDFNLNDVTGTTPNIVEYLSQLEFYLTYNAMQMGLDPAEWVIVMRPDLWFVLTEIWPCQYNTNRCATAIIGANSQTFIDGADMAALRDDMRQNMYIFINGKRYPVVTDTGIFEHNNINNGNLNPGQYASSIYMVPLRITGNFPVTYIEHVDYRAGARDVSILRGLETFWTDRGIFSWAVEDQKWCYKLSVKTEPRVVLRTPQLAGRIDNILYEPLQHLRESYADSPYFADGGVSLRGADSKYAVWL